MKTNWLRVTRQRPCPICEKPDWCMVAADGSAAICQRIESDKPVGTKGAGWLHRLQDSDWQPPKRRTVERKAKQTPTIDWDARQQRYTSNLTDDGCTFLADELGLSVAMLRRFGVGWCCSRSCWTFPMRNHAGRIVGIRTRPMVGDKESDSGTDGTGMFFVPVSIKPDYLLIVEGASDAIAMHDIGFESVIGRSNRNGSTKQIITLRRRLKPKHIIIVPDNDKPGIDGAEELVTMLSMLNQQANLLLLHDHINDVRDCVQTQKNADWLRNRIGESISASPSSEGINQ